MMYCDRCKITFLTKHDYYYHNRKCDLNKLTDDQDPELNTRIVGKLECKVCNITYTDRCNLNRHLKTKLHKKRVAAAQQMPEPMPRKPIHVNLTSLL